MAQLCRYFSRTSSLPLLDGIDLRAVGGLLDQPDVVGHLQEARVMPSCLIQLHHDEIVTQALAYIGQEQVHHGGIGCGQDQAEEFAGLRSHGREHLEKPP